MAQQEEAGRRNEADQRFLAPQISAPKGGGAIRGIGEKFAANPVTGTGSLSVPISTPPGRSGFGPQLSLSYDSGTGNGPFGFGWSLSLPSVSRKTDKGLPEYRDAAESDVFLLSGAEDLVPVLEEVDGRWVRPDPARQTLGEVEYRVQTYRPRTEGLFARIERWTAVGTGEVHWRSINRDNVTTLYGRDNRSRVFDPADPDPLHPTRVFQWLICESRDDRGNVLHYEYLPEDARGVDITQAHERNRTDGGRAANRYLSRILYGNRVSRLTDAEPADPGWMFEVVLDYGGYDADAPTPRDTGAWLCRRDPFSSHRAGFEVRAYRLCQRVLVFHHFPGEDGVGTGCLVRSTDFTYRDAGDTPADRGRGEPVASFITAITQCGYRRRGSGYLKRWLPPLELTYSTTEPQQEVRDVDPADVENLPAGVDGSRSRWVDLDGEGVSGILTEQGSAWYYKPNLGGGRFGPMEAVAARPSLAAVRGRGQQLLDLDGDGRLDLVDFGGPVPGFYERTSERGWEPFTAFVSVPKVFWGDPNLKFVDLDGDGHTDVLVAEGDAFTWYPSRAEEGFGPARRVRVPVDEEAGPPLVFADGTQSVYLADMSGDGLTDLVRIRNGEVCYWPSLGHGRFGARVTMDDSPWLDAQDQFDQRRVRIADIDGSGNTDLVYLGRDGVRLYFNQSGNRWSGPHLLPFPVVDDVASVEAVDLLGTGTACLVWSSPLPGDERRPLRFVELMGGKPHLLVGVRNNLGAETVVRYAPSTRFYLADRAAGRPWVTRLPFPVHVVELVETYDRVSRNRFVTRYAYHHGHFDGAEREFRGFGMVEQWDTEELAALTADGVFPTGENVDAASQVPPVRTRTWYHTGAWLEGARVARHYEGEYYREGDASLDEPGVSGTEFQAMLLPDTELPGTLLRPDGGRGSWALSAEEARQAVRALRGSLLRQEVHALDGTEADDRPYRVSERSYAVELLQPQSGNPHAVFFTHARETVELHYERRLFDVGGTLRADPRVTHELTLEVDGYGNVLKSATAAYGRRHPNPDPGFTEVDRAEQGRPRATFTESAFTNAVGGGDAHRAPLVCESRTWELTGYAPSAAAGWFHAADLARPASGGRLDAVFDREAAYEEEPGEGRMRRLIEHVRTYYRPDTLGDGRGDPLALLRLGALEPLALVGEVYKLACTPGLLARVYRREREGLPAENLLRDPAAVLPAAGPGGASAGRGGYVDLDGDGRWWIPSGRVFRSPGSGDGAATERDHARRHFYLPHRYRDPFGETTTVAYDAHYLLVVETRDPLGNRVTAGERDLDPNRPLARGGNDYRVLQPTLVMDPNRNRAAAAFDALGMVVATAVMGKPEDAPRRGDLLDGFDPDPDPTAFAAYLDDPLSTEQPLLGRATTRLVYDLFAYDRTKGTPAPQPTAVHTLARETHDAEPGPDPRTPIQHSFSFRDGFGREIQKKARAEPGPVPRRDPVTGRIVVVDGRPEMTDHDASPRWVGSGWTVFNNKGKPVRRYEPFFSDTCRFEFDVRIGVSPVLFYDPVERVVATLHPDHTWEKVVFDPWRQETWDASDTVLSDPAADPDAGGFFRRLPAAEYLPTWHARRMGGALGPRERDAARKAAVHAGTASVSHFDALGRAFLTIAHNRFKRGDIPAEAPPAEERYRTRVVFDIEGNQREVIDARGRVVMRHDHDMLGNRLRQASMEAGERWTLNDASGKPIRAWDSRGHGFRTEYDALRRPVRHFVSGTDAARSDPRTLGRDVLFEKTEYGEDVTDGVALNLRGRVFRTYDGAGVVTHAAYDFKGNLLRSTRELAPRYADLVDWGVPQPAGETFESATAYDAQNRPVALTTPHNADVPASTVRPTYNQAGLLEAVDANLRGAEAGGRPLWTPFVVDIDYDAKGQRTRIIYGNGVETRYRYDPDTFRLVQLYTRRGGAFTDDCGGDPPPPRLAAPPEPPPDRTCGVQNLRYTYDAAGNIVHVRDDAQQTVFFANHVVEPSAAYTYDALFRLIEATGREHLGQGVAGAPSPSSYGDRHRTGRPLPGDGAAMGRFLQRFFYDELGNLLEMVHHGDDPTQAGWRRTYGYEEPSLLEPRTASNRLTRTTVSARGGRPVDEVYGHDAHGNKTRMPQLQEMHWDFRDRLRTTRRQAVSPEDVEEVERHGERTFYVYDASGERVRKITEFAGGAVKDERIYLGGFEIYRRGGTSPLVRETLHVMDDRRRIALVETRTEGDDGSPPQVVRYQHGNHLGSATLELDADARILSYEEYHPFGTTSYQAVDGRIETPRRYRYTGKERDEESGLYYHGARYYAPWLGRWTSCDPAGLVDGPNLYAYVRGNPLSLRDPDGRDPVAQPIETPSPGPGSYRLPDPSAERSRAPYGVTLGSFQLRTSLPGPPLPWGAPGASQSPGSSSAPPAAPPASRSQAATPPATGGTDDGPRFSGQLFPPRLEVRWGPVELDVTTSSAELRLTRVGAGGEGQLGLSYAYGGNLTLTSGSRSGAGSVGVDPSSGALTFGVESRYPGGRASFSVTTQGTMSVGVTAPRFSASAEVTGSGSVSASVTIGGAPVPAASSSGQVGDLAGPVRAGAEAVERLLPDPLPIRGELSNIPDVVSQRIDDFRAIGGAVSAVRSVTDLPRAPRSPELRLRLGGEYNPTPSTGPSPQWSVGAALQVIY